MQHLKKLQVLDLARTNISSLPDWLSTLPLLHTLDLGGSDISEVPQILQHCTSLRTIRLAASRGDFGYDRCPLAKSQVKVEQLRQLVPFAKVTT